jgi:hypothetical protein
MDYEFHLRKEAFEFLLARKKSDREAILCLLRRLEANPFQDHDFEERDSSGRPIYGIIFNRFAVIYFCDHLAKELRILDIRSAD